MCIRDRRSLVQPVDAKIYVPIVERKTAQVLSISGNVVQLMDMETYSTFEIKVTDAELAKLEEGKDVQYLTSMGKIKLDIR